jgi:predicted GNAT family N-acyltransferase
VDKEFRGASVGSKLFAEFIDMCRREGKYERMVFMAKEDLVPVYERMGISTVGKAEVELGKDVWYEMCITFRDVS